MSRGLNNNNPGNIRKSSVRYQGEIDHSTDRDFKQFRTMAWGYRAIMKLIESYQKRYGLNTIRKVISRYAPSFENNTSAYIKAVCQRSGIAPDEEFSYKDREEMIGIVAAMSFVENGTAAIMSQVEEGADLFYAK